MTDLSQHQGRIQEITAALSKTLAQFETEKLINEDGMSEDTATSVILIGIAEMLTELVTSLTLCERAKAGDMGYILAAKVKGYKPTERAWKLRKIVLMEGLATLKGEPSVLDGIDV